MNGTAVKKLLSAIIMRFWQILIFFLIDKNFFLGPQEYVASVYDVEANRVSFRRDENRSFYPSSVNEIRNVNPRTETTMRTGQNNGSKKATKNNCAFKFVVITIGFCAAVYVIKYIIYPICEPI